MKRPSKLHLPRQQMAAIGAGAGLLLLSVLLILFGVLYAGREVLLVGLIGILPAMIQVILLLPRCKKPAPPVADPELPPKKTKRLQRRYRCKLRYIKWRNPLAAVLIGVASLAVHVIFWRFTGSLQGAMSYLIPVILAVVFVAAIALEKWCTHSVEQSDAYTAALLRSIAGAFLVLRIAVLICAAAVTLTLIGLFDARGIARVLMGILLVYETATLAFCVGVRLIRKDLVTKPELLVNLIAMGADLNLLSYLEENTGITMRSLWSLRLIKRLLPGAVLGVALLVWLSTCFVQIDVHQQGAVFRLGKLQKEPLNPGFHLTLPWPFDKTDIYDTGSVRKVTIGYIPTVQQDNTWTKAHGEEEYLLLLGNGNEMVSINLQVEYRIDDLLAYIRSSASPESLLQAQAYEIVTARTIVSDLDSLLAADRESFSTTFREELTQRIAPYHTGLTVVDVVLESIHPPVKVADIYQKTIGASIDAGYILLKAETEANTRLLGAQQQANQIVSNAKSDKYTRIGEAQAAVTEFMAAAAADGAYRDEYRFYKYLDAITQTYQKSTLVIAGNGIDTSCLVISTYKDEPFEEPPEFTGDDEFEEEYFS